MVVLTPSVHSDRAVASRVLGLPRSGPSAPALTREPLVPGVGAGEPPPADGPVLDGAECLDLGLASHYLPAAKLAGVKAEEGVPLVAPLLGLPVPESYPPLRLSAEQQRAMSVSTIVRAIPRFPPNHRVTAALERMQNEGSHMAAVVDQYGNLLGIVTIEDLLEEIVGDITDEYEVARRRFERDRARVATGAAPTKARSPGSVNSADARDS